jgi:hypothetical protein
LKSGKAPKQNKCHQEEEKVSVDIITLFSLLLTGRQNKLVRFFKVFFRKKSLMTLAIIETVTKLFPPHFWNV